MCIAFLEKLVFSNASLPHNTLLRCGHYLLNFKSSSFPLRELKIQRRVEMNKLIFSLHPSPHNRHGCQTHAFIAKKIFLFYLNFCLTFSSSKPFFLIIGPLCFNNKECLTVTALSTFRLLAFLNAHEYRVFQLQGSKKVPLQLCLVLDCLIFLFVSCVILFYLKNIVFQADYSEYIRGHKEN